MPCCLIVSVFLLRKCTCYQTSAILVPRPVLILFQDHSSASHLLFLINVVTGNIFDVATIPYIMIQGSIYFLRSVMSAFLMDFLDKSKGISLATTSVFSIKVLFYVFVSQYYCYIYILLCGKFAIAESLCVVGRMMLNFLLLIFTQI